MMLVAYKDKDGGIHVGTVSAAEGERINREVSERGYASPPAPKDEEKADQEIAERIAENGNAELLGLNESFGELRGSYDVDQLSSDSEMDSFLFQDIALDRDGLCEVEIRLLRQVLKAFYGLRFYNSRGEIALADRPEDMTETSQSASTNTLTSRRSAGDISIESPEGKKYTEVFPLSFFKDILTNCVRGKGSFKELLLLALYHDAKRELEYFQLFSSSSISFDTFRYEVTDEVISEYKRVRSPLREKQYDDDWVRFFEQNDVKEWNDKWLRSYNVMVGKVFWYIDLSIFELTPVLLGLPEKDWKGSILTEDFFEHAGK